MANVIRQTRTVETRRSNDYDDPVVESAPHSTTVLVARLIYTLFGILVGLLALRFILALLGANVGNPFTDLIYNITTPFVAPFFGMFGYKIQYGVSRFELETLIAMAVYSLLAWVIVRLMTLGSTSDTV